MHIWLHRHNGFISSGVSSECVGSNICLPTRESSICVKEKKMGSENVWSLAFIRYLWACEAVNRKCKCPPIRFLPHISCYIYFLFQISTPSFSPSPYFSILQANTYERNQRCGFHDSRIYICKGEEKKRMLSVDLFLFLYCSCNLYGRI